MKVYAKNDDIKKNIKHPTGPIRFNEDGSANWPDDQFTRRRIRDGDVTTEPPTPPEGQSRHHRRSHTPDAA
jgi:hypothetical protein